jgi:hypothetical protein
MNGETNEPRSYAPVQVGSRFAGQADWGVMVRTGGVWKLVCVGCTRKAAGELVARLNANQPPRTEER